MVEMMEALMVVHWVAEMAVHWVAVMVDSLVV
jgi:hypothetical protein